jgi:hypothetical protein
MIVIIFNTLLAQTYVLKHLAAVGDAKDARPVFLYPAC